MRTLIQQATPHDKEWDATIQPELRPAAGKVRLAPLMSLMYQHNLGGSAWLSQFIFGFKLIGTLSQKHVFPPSDKMLGRDPKTFCLYRLRMLPAFRKELPNRAIKMPRPYGAKRLHNSAKAG